MAAPDGPMGSPSTARSGRLPFPRPWLLRVRGHSMTPTYRDGDLLFALRGGRARTGVAVVCLPPDGNGRARPLSVKRISPAAGQPGRWWVTSDDPRGVGSEVFGAIADRDVLGRVLIRLSRSRRTSPADD